MRGLFKGAQYNPEAGAKCAVYSRARTKQGHGVIKEIRYINLPAVLLFKSSNPVSILPTSQCESESFPKAKRPRRHFQSGSKSSQVLQEVPKVQ